MYLKASAAVLLLVLCCCSVNVFSYEERSKPVRRDLGLVDWHRRALLADNNTTQNDSSSSKQSSGGGGGHGLNPSVVIIVVILTVVFLLSGFLHLLARCCGRVVSRREPTEGPMSALHGQLQHLFQLHDSGVDQAFIDTLPVFPYKSICGLKEGTDCAVCLSEFEGEDRLRLLPKCKHAFHIDCIDTWLLSHSTCPLCRCSLLSDDLAAANGPLSDSPRIGSTRSMQSNGYLGDSRRSSELSKRMIASSSMFAEQGGGSESDRGKDDDIRMEFDSPGMLPASDRTESETSVCSVLSVKLGRVGRRAPNNESFGGSSILNGRSYSMGSYEYIVNPSNLQVVIAPTPHPGRGNAKEFAQGSRPRHRSVFSDGIPEIGSSPGTPADELFWATRGLATPEYRSSRDAGTHDFFGTPDFLSRKTPDFSREGDGKVRLSLGSPASDASLVPKGKEQLGVVGGGKGKEKAVVGKGKEWVSIDLESKEDCSSECSIVEQRVEQRFEQRAVSPLQEVLKGKSSESEESRVLAGLERFFGTGWRSNVGLEKLAESMSRSDRSFTKSKPTSEQGEAVRDNHSVSSSSFSFRFPVMDTFSKLGRSRRLSESSALDKGSASVTSAFDAASNDATGYETATSKDGGYETASKESLGGLDTSSVGSFSSLFIATPPTQQRHPQDNGGSRSETSQNSGSLAKKTLHWLMGRDRRVVYAANFSPPP